MLSRLWASALSAWTWLKIPLRNADNLAHVNLCGMKICENIQHVSVSVSSYSYFKLAGKYDWKECDVGRSWPAQPQVLLP